MVVIECNTAHGSVMAFKRVQQVTGRNVPQLDCFVVATGCKDIVFVEGKARDKAGMPFDGVC
jgi:hypothetical protein